MNKQERFGFVGFIHSQLDCQCHVNDLLFWGHRMSVS